MISISPANEMALRYLAFYKFLSTDQLQKLTNVKHKQQVYENLRNLRDKGLIDSLVYGAVTRVGTTIKLNFLTYKGAKALGKLPDLEIIRFPKSTTTLFKNDFYHRIHTIDLWISFNLWLQSTAFRLLFYDVYFDSIGHQKSDILKSTSKTKVTLSENSCITPDCIFAIEKPEGEQKLYILEVTNGRDTGRTTRQITNNLLAMYKGFVSNKYSIKKTPLLLVAFENEIHKDGVKKAIFDAGFLSTFKNIEHYLFFALQKEATENWKLAWEDIHGNKANLF